MNHDQVYCTINCLPTNIALIDLVYCYTLTLNDAYYFRSTLIYKIPVNVS